MNLVNKLTCQYPNKTGKPPAYQISQFYLQRKWAVTVRGRGEMDESVGLQKYLILSLLTCNSLLTTCVLVLYWLDFIYERSWELYVAS